MESTTNPEQITVSDNIVKVPQTSHPTLKEWLINHKWKIILLLIIAVLLAVGSVVLYFYLQPNVTVVDVSEIMMPDQTLFVMATLKLYDRNIIEQNFQYTMYATYPVEDKTGRRLQSSSSTVLLHSFQQQIGINIRMTTQGNTDMFVNQNKFLNYTEQQLAKQGTNDKNMINNGNNATSKEFFSQLDSIFTQSLEKAGIKNLQVKFVDQKMANLKINSNNHMLEFDLNANKRLLVEAPRKLFFLAGLLKIATAIIPKVAGFFTSTVTKFAPMLGKVIGGFTGGMGGMGGGPLGIIQGIMSGTNLGGMIGSAASSFVNACIPQGSSRISCTPSSIGSVMSQFGVSQGLSGLGSALNVFGGGGGGFFSNIVNSIPQQALSMFGFGNLFPK